MLLSNEKNAPASFLNAGAFLWELLAFICCQYFQQWASIPEEGISKTGYFLKLWEANDTNWDHNGAAEG